jgi:hypothetical protein
MLRWRRKQECYADRISMALKDFSAEAGLAFGREIGLGQAADPQ